MEKKPMKSKSTFFKIVLKILTLTQMKASFMGEGGGVGFSQFPRSPFLLGKFCFLFLVFFLGGAGSVQCTQLLTNVQNFKYQNFIVSEINYSNVTKHRK